MSLKTLRKSKHQRATIKQKYLDYRVKSRLLGTSNWKPFYDTYKAYADELKKTAFCDYRLRAWRAAVYLHLGEQFLNEIEDVWNRKIRNLGRGIITRRIKRIRRLLPQSRIKIIAAVIYRSRSIKRRRRQEAAEERRLRAIKSAESTVSGDLVSAYATYIDAIAKESSSLIYHAGKKRTLIQSQCRLSQAREELAKHKIQRLQSLAVKPNTIFSRLILFDREKWKIMSTTGLECSLTPEDVLRDIRWVYNNLPILFSTNADGTQEIHEEILATAPSAGALAMARYAIANYNAFFEKFVVRIMPKIEMKTVERTVSAEESESMPDDPTLGELDRFLTEADNG